MQQKQEGRGEVLLDLEKRCSRSKRSPKVERSASGTRNPHSSSSSSSSSSNVNGAEARVLGGTVAAAGAGKAKPLQQLAVGPTSGVARFRKEGRRRLVAGTGKEEVCAVEAVVLSAVVVVVVVGMIVRMT